jgi:hypothetical protein
MAGPEPDTPDDLDATHDDEIILPRLFRSLLLQGRKTPRGSPIQLDWGYLTGKVDRPRSSPPVQPGAPADPEDDMGGQAPGH